MQTPDRRKGLVEAGAASLWPTVAVPAPVRPLPLHQPLREQPFPLVAGGSEAGGDSERVALLRPAPPRETVDDGHVAAVRRAGQPGQHLLQALGGNAAHPRARRSRPATPGASGRHATSVRANSEATVGLLAREQGPDEPSVENAGLDATRPLPQQISPDKMPDGRLLRRQEPVDGIHVDSLHVSAQRFPRCTRCPGRRSGPTPSACAARAPSPRSGAPHPLLADA